MKGRAEGSAEGRAAGLLCPLPPELLGKYRKDRKYEIGELRPAQRGGDSHKPQPEKGGKGSLLCPA